MSGFRVGGLHFNVDIVWDYYYVALLDQVILLLD